MEKFRKLTERCKCGIFLTVNEHRDYYETAETTIKEWRETGRIDYEDVNSGLEEDMVKSNTIISLQFYPDTPIGSYSIYGTDIEEVINQALEVLEIK